jgi:hypothetical protein
MNMNTQLKLLPILTAVTLAAFSLEPVKAQNARFSYEPNVWRAAAPRKKEEFAPVAPPHNVKDGSVPHNDMLGLDDPRLASHPAITPPLVPIQRIHLAAKPATTSTKAVPLPMNSPFQANFGKPITPPVMANLPKPATPLALPQDVAKPATAKGLPAKSSYRSSKDLHGTLLTPQKRTVVPSRASALALNPKVDSYGKNVGYTPGAYLPSANSGSGMRTSADVHGTVIPKTRMGR